MGLRAAERPDSLSRTTWRFDEKIKSAEGQEIGGRAAALDSSVARQSRHKSVGGNDREIHLVAGGTALNFRQSRRCRANASCLVPSRLLKIFSRPKSSSAAKNALCA